MLDCAYFTLVPIRLFLFLWSFSPQKGKLGFKQKEILFSPPRIAHLLTNFLVRCLLKACALDTHSS